MLPTSLRVRSECGAGGVLRQNGSLKVVCDVVEVDRGGGDVGVAHQRLQLLDPRVRTSHEQRAVGVAQHVRVREPYNQKQIERAVRRAAERAGLGDVLSGTNVIERAPTPHDLRHSHASALIAARWDVESVSRRLGHADSAITLRTYTHEFEAARRREEQRRSLTALYGSVVEANERSGAQQTGQASLAEVAHLQRKRDTTR